VLSAVRLSDITLLAPMHFGCSCSLVDHPRCGVVYDFGRVCLSVCQTITFESLDVETSNSHIRYISMEYGSSSCMKVIGSRSRSQEQKKVEDSYSSNENFDGHISASRKDRTMRFAYIMGLSAMTERVL